MSDKREPILRWNIEVDEYCLAPYPDPDGFWVKAEDCLALQTELDDIKEAYKNTVEEKCAGDERHCSCVPALRAEIERLQGQLNDISLSLDFCPGAVRVHEGCGPENIPASIAVTLHKLTDKEQ